MSEEKLARFLLQGIEDGSQEEIGKGAYCTVVKMRFRGLTCAGKKIHHFFTHHLSPNERQALLDRFVEECELLSGLHHPNIIQFLGVHRTDQGMPILVMELMEKSLTSLIEEEGAIHPESSYRILKDIALGLAYLHGHNPPIVHRDLSSNNVLLTVGRRAKLADLGVARLLDISPTTAAKVTQCPGTPIFMPPEALHDDPSYDVRIDCFSFGVLIVHILSGEWPIPSPPTCVNPVTLALEAVSEYDRRGKYVQGIPEHLLLILARQCLENNPQRRPLMMEALQEIERYEVTVDSPALVNREVRDLTEDLQVCREKLQSSQADVERLALSQSVLEAQVKELERAQDEKVNLHHSIRDLSKSLEDKERSIVSLTHQLSRLQTFLSRTSPFPSVKIEWEKCTDIPSAASNLCVVSMYDAVYVGSGQSDEHVIKRSLYATKDFVSWQTFDLLPVTAYGFCKGITKLVIVSGIAFDTGTVTNSLIMFDPIRKKSEYLTYINGRFSLRARVQEGRVRCSAYTVYSQEILVIGGINSKGDVVDSCDSLVIETGEWKPLPPLPKPLYSATCLFANNRLLVAGGFSSSKPLLPNQDVFSLDWKTKEWSKLCTAPYSYSCYVLLAGMLTAINGCNSKGDRIQTVSVFSEASKTWVKIGDFPEDLISCGGSCLPTGELVVVGGFKSNKTRSSSVYRGRMIF